MADDAPRPIVRIALGPRPNRCLVQVDGLSVEGVTQHFWKDAPLRNLTVWRNVPFGPSSLVRSSIENALATTRTNKTPTFWPPFLWAVQGMYDEVRKKTFYMVAGAERLDASGVPLGVSAVDRLVDLNQESPSGSIHLLPQSVETLIAVTAALSNVPYKPIVQLLPESNG